MPLEHCTWKPPEQGPEAPPGRFCMVSPQDQRPSPKAHGTARQDCAELSVALPLGVSPSRVTLGLPSGRCPAVCCCPAAGGCLVASPRGCVAQGGGSSHPRRTRPCTELLSTCAAAELLALRATPLGTGRASSEARSDLRSPVAPSSPPLGKLLLSELSCLGRAAENRDAQLALRRGRAGSHPEVSRPVERPAVLLPSRRSPLQRHLAVAAC